MDERTPVKPTRMQAFFAGNGPVKIWFTILPLWIAWAELSRLDLSVELLKNFSTGAAAAGAVLAAWVLGFFTAFLLAWFFLGPVYRHRGRVNGAPYKAGDEVQVLVDPHRGRIAVVYEVWADRGQVRVDLGESEKRALKDIFTNTQVLRRSAPAAG
jgi:uncharacterized protein (DUF58 family)